MSLSFLSRLIVAAVVAGLALAACGPASPASPGKAAQSALARVAAPDVPDDDLARLAADNNAFAFGLYRTLSKGDGNIIYSPYSLSLALAMTYAGARGTTGSQMASALHFSLPPDRLHPAFNKLDLELAGRGQAASRDVQPLQLNIANAIWAEQQFEFLPEYLDLLALNYGAGVHLADFINRAEQERQGINDWVKDQTRGKIENLIPQGAVDALTRLVLVNAIYFKADWDVPFDAADTAEAPFHLLDGATVQVPTMNHSFGSLQYFKGEGYQLVELPYQGGTAALDLLVPDTGSFAPVEQATDAAKLQAALDAARPASVQLSLPKFEFSGEFSLSGQLAALGMTDAFDADKADFSGMDGRRDLFVSAVVHKAYVAVDEKGTEAAAASGVIMKLTSAMLPDVILQVDRPFMFFIRDLPTGQILFAGRVVDPGK